MAKGNPTKRCDRKPLPGCGMVGGMQTKPSDRRHEVALLRFRVVNYIADRQREGICLAQALREASTRPWPDESGNYFACRTIEDWWYVHAKGGFPALVDAPRRDNGNFRVIDAPTGQWIIEQVSQSPKIHLSVLYTHWQNLDRQLPSLRSVYRYLRRHGYDKARLRAGRLESGPTHAFEAPMPNDLWMVDFSPGPTIRENGSALSTQLCVLIDDCSRLIPFGGYYRRADTEKVPSRLQAGRAQARITQGALHRSGQALRQSSYPHCLRQSWYPAFARQTLSCLEQGKSRTPDPNDSSRLRGRLASAGPTGRQPG